MSFKGLVSSHRKGGRPNGGPRQLNERPDQLLMQMQTTSSFERLICDLSEKFLIVSERKKNGKRGPGFRQLFFCRPNVYL